MEKDFSNYKQRILKYAKYKGLSKRQIYIDTGISNGTFDKKSGLTETNIEKFISTYQEVNVEWLITGQGEMIKNRGDEIEEPAKIYKLNQNRKTKDAIIEGQIIPLYDFNATAGLQELFSNEKRTQVLDTIRIPNLPRCDGAITITGDSMYPLLKSGDMVLYAETSPKNIFWGEMYLIGIKLDDDDEYITVKYVHKSEVEGHIKLVSQNAHHNPKDIPLSAVRAIALVKASIRINTII